MVLEKRVTIWLRQSHCGLDHVPWVRGHCCFFAIADCDLPSDIGGTLEVCTGLLFSNEEKEKKKKGLLMILYTSVAHAGLLYDATSLVQGCE